MGFMDKVMNKAQEVGKAGQAKVDAVQAKHHMDDLYRQIGSVTYASRTGRAKPEDAARLDQAYAGLRELETSHPELFSTSAAGYSGAPAGAEDAGPAAATVEDTGTEPPPVGAPGQPV